MPEQKIYVHNSDQKNFIRGEWLKFVKDVLGNKKHLDIILFPAEEMQELHFYAENGLITWNETETGSYNITNGKVICFEKKTAIFMALKKKLVGAIVESAELGLYLRSKYQGIMEKKAKTFPVDVINLDYDGNLSKNKVPVSEIIELLFKFQALHGRSFSLFMTWPETESEDEQPYKELLKNIILNNLKDPRAGSFTESFYSSFTTVEELDYDNLSIIGMIKMILSISSNNQYSLYKNEFYIYGGTGGRKKMYSILLNFEFCPETPSHEIYSSTVVKSLQEIKDLNQELNSA